MERFVGGYIKWREDPANKEVVEEEERQTQSIKKRYEAMSKHEQKANQRILSLDEAYEDIVDFMKPRTEEEFKNHKTAMEIARKHRRMQELIREGVGALPVYRPHRAAATNGDSHAR
eukprot:5331564-Prymnesium_polylepis.1